MPLERTAFGSPISGVAPKKARVNTNALTALSNMAALGSKVATAFADNQEKKAIMDAQNDLVNNSINPDKEVHQAAYAWTIAEGLANKSYNDTKEQIKAGVYDEVDPENFQKKMQQDHEEFYNRVGSNPFGEQSMSSYNQFMLKNSSALTSAQAGRWRVKQGENQGNALRVRIAEMARGGLSTVQDYMAEIESEKYTLVSPEMRTQVALLGASDQAAETGDTDLLEELDKAFGYSADPKLSGSYAAALKAADRKHFAMSEQDKFKVISTIDAMQDSGTLTEAQWPLVQDLKDSKGNPLYTQKEFNNKVRASRVKLAEGNAKEQYRVQFTSGVDLSCLSKSDARSFIVFQSWDC